MIETNRPIFIIGVHRSGTTLLRFILSSHPAIYIPPESDFIPRFFQQQPRQTLSGKQVKRYLEIIFDEYRFVNDWVGEQPDAAKFYAQMRTKSPPAFLDTLYSLYARQYNASRWGDKTPIYASYINLLSSLFPQAVFIHIIRDPRDAAVSLLGKYAQREFHVDIFFAARNWVRRIQRARRDGLSLGRQHYYEIHYEDLIQNPEENIRLICNFIEEDFHPAMLNHSGLAQELIPEESHFFDQVREPIHNQRVGRWRKELPDRDVRLVEFICGDLMRSCGYSPEFDSRSLPWREQIRMLGLGSKYLVLQSGRKLLELAGMVPPI